MPSRLARRFLFAKIILSLEKPILPDFAYAVITPVCEIGVGIRHTAAEKVPTRSMKMAGAEMYRCLAKITEVNVTNLLDRLTTMSK